MAFSYSGILAWVTMIGDFTFSLVLYFTITLYLVQSELSFLDYALGFVPNGGNLRAGLKHLISDKIEGVFNSNIEGAIYQAVFTWIVFDFAEIKYVFIYCLLAAFFKTVPFVSTSLIGVVGAL